MTEHEALPEGDLAAWDDAYGGDYQGDYQGDYRGDYQGDYEGDYPGWAAQPPLRPTSPWYRSPRLLLVLIGLAAAVLVVATALLVTGRQSGEMPATSRLESRTSAAVSPTPTSSPPSRTSPSSGSLSTSPSSTPEPSTELDVTAGPAEPAPPVSAAPTAGQPRNPTGPRINVTRTPMSFTPGKVG